MAWHGMAWHGMAWHGMAWHGMATYSHLDRNLHLVVLLHNVGHQARQTVSALCPASSCHYSSLYLASSYHYYQMLNPIPPHCPRQPSQYKNVVSP